ncbi:MAG TPA: SDR family oxidoreductase [Bryocella sp.]|nr:SDR family oxidoreductase [Bryocella sp.]
MAAKKQSRPEAKVYPLLPPAAPLRLTGKVALITGASRGIGFAIARALALEGCDIILTARDPANLTKAAAHLRTEVKNNSKIVAMACDVRAPESVGRLFAVVKRRFGKLDILINNAGISQPPTPLEQTSLELWRNQIDTNLTSLFLCTRAALPLMQRGATIVNTISAAAKQVFPNYYGYTAAKTGALGFTLSLRAELVPRGIRVTALIPGATVTDIWQQITPDGKAPFHHMIQPENIAQAVLYAVLLPPEATLSEVVITPALGSV